MFKNSAVFELVRAFGYVTTEYSKVFAIHLKQLDICQLHQSRSVDVSIMTTVSEMSNGS